MRKATENCQFCFHTIGIDHDDQNQVRQKHQRANRCTNYDPGPLTTGTFYTLAYNATQYQSDTHSGAFMSDQTPLLHLVCGKIAAGKSTLARSLCNRPSIVLLSEDQLLSTLYSGEINSIADYVQRTNQLRGAIGGHISNLLRAGVTVVLDFPANTKKIRNWMRSLGDAAGVDVHLHYLDISDDICLARLNDRNAKGTHEFAATEAQFKTITSYFEAPSEEEGLILKEYSSS
jgi:predicted kinase